MKLINHDFECLNISEDVIMCDFPLTIAIFDKMNDSSTNVNDQLSTVTTV